MNIDDHFGARAAWNSAAARALTILHERELRTFLDLWSDARRRGIKLPVVEDPDYASMEALLVHVLRSARYYLREVCPLLALGVPDLPAAPSPLGNASDKFVVACLAHMELILDAYRTQLCRAQDENFLSPSVVAPWGVTYCADSFLEHAAMHPKRHALQLELLLAEQTP